MKSKYVLYTLIGVLFAGLGVYLGIHATAPAKPADSVVAGFFASRLSDLEARPQSLDQWKGKTLVVNFWATWCAPCVEEMPELSALQNQLAAQNVQILGIGIDSASNMKEFSAKHRIHYPLYIAGMEGTDLARRFGNTAGGLPFTVLIAPSGKIEKTYLGKLDMKQLRRDVDTLGKR